MSNTMMAHENNSLTKAAKIAILYHKINIQSADMVRELVTSGYSETERALVYSALLALELYDNERKARSVRQIVRGWFRIR
jgi:hypothetical protein